MREQPLQGRDPDHPYMDLPCEAIQAGTSFKKRFHVRPCKMPLCIHMQLSTTRSLPAVSSAVLVYSECCVHAVLPRCAHTARGHRPHPRPSASARYMSRWRGIRESCICCCVVVIFASKTAADGGGAAAAAAACSRRPARQ